MDLESYGGPVPGSLTSRAGVELAPWNGRPASARLIVLCWGDLDSLDAFLPLWLRWRGQLDVRGALVTGTKSGTREVALMVVFDVAPAEFVLQWCLEQSGRWEVFYQRSAGSRSKDPADRLSGVFLPWGLDLSGKNALPMPTDAAALRPDGEWLDVGQPLRSVFELRDHGLLVFSAPREMPAAEVRTDAFTGAPRPLPLEISLVRATEGGTVAQGALRRELRRVEQMIHELELRREALSLRLVESSVPIDMYIYREAPDEKVGAGSHWSLRSWFASAPDRDLEEFEHARVEIVGDEPFPLHLVVPRRLDRAPRAVLPRPAYTLTLDQRWYRWQRQVYVSRGLELHPEPPVGGAQMVSRLEKTLWDVGEPHRHRLILLGGRDGRAARFLVGHERFAPLSQCLNLLNIRTSIDLTPERQAQQIAKMAEELRQTLLARIDDHVQGVKSALREAWETGGMTLDKLRRGTEKAVESAKEIETRIDRLEKLAQRSRQAWPDFVKDVLDTDRATARSLGGTAGWLEGLDDLRASVRGRDLSKPDEFAEIRTKLAHLARKP
jgi:hypothetical protein